MDYNNNNSFNFLEYASRLLHDLAIIQITDSFSKKVRSTKRRSKPKFKRLSDISRHIDELIPAAALEFSFIAHKVYSMAQDYAVAESFIKNADRQNVAYFKDKVIFATLLDHSPRLLKLFNRYLDY